MDHELVGTTLADRYLIEERIGAGATGEVYRARHVKIGKAFAVKVLHARLLDDPKVAKRFEREAELAGTLKHPNIVGVVDVGATTEGHRYMVMELAVGEPLSMVIAAQGPMPAQRAIPLLRQLCDALHHAHDRGLVHRDFKPDNVIVERRPDGTDFARIIDFGIAILRDDLSGADSGRLTTSGIVLGTPQYLAPEQAFGNGDHRIDLFALGVVSYELLTGRLPFDGEGAEIARANLTQDTPPMGVRVPFLDVDPLLEAFTRQLMSKSPELRPETGKVARELLDLIERDRNAAAELLGIDPETLNRRMVGRTEQSQPVQRVSIGDTHESQPVRVSIGDTSESQSIRDSIGDTDESPPLGHPTDLAIPVEGMAVARARSIAPPAPRSRRGMVIGGTAVAAIAIGAIVIGASGGSSTTDSAVVKAPPPEEPAPSPAPDDRVPTPVEPSRDNTAPAPTRDNATRDNTAPAPTRDNAPARAPIVPDQTQTPVKPAPVKPAPVKPTPPKPTVTQQPKPTPKTVPEPPADPTAKELADLYVAVGRDLKAYSEKKGANAESLSDRYRLIKIAEALATGDRRRVAAKELQAIRKAAR